MKKTLVVLLVLAVSALAFGADDKDEKDATKAEDRIQAAATVLDEIETAPDTGIPEEVLASAECVMVVPSLLKGGFHRGRALWPRSRELQDSHRLECSRIHFHQRRECGFPNRRPGN